MSQASHAIEYRLKVSTRARHVRLRVKPYLGLEITVPKRFPKKYIPEILQQHESWIARQLQEQQQSLQAIALPQHIQLSCLQQTFSIGYETSAKIRLSENADQLIIQHETEQQAIKLLRNWIRRLAKTSLTPRLHELAREFGFKFDKVAIRSQKSRWGSCSSSGTISLNDQLLFMPAATVRYLMIHELCHTRFMNHSMDFWKLVSDCCPAYRQHEQQLSRGREIVPGWFQKSLYRK